MRYHVVVEDEAHAEISNVLIDCANTSLDRAARFRLEIERALERLADFPEMYALLKPQPETLKAKVRRVLIDGFSFGLLYIVLHEHEEVRVFKCYPTRSNPDTWLES